ncbi:MAG: pseudouridine synthase [Spirochaetaceae bacterium]
MPPTNRTADEYPMRLHVYLARAGVASRRRSEALIAEGEVEVNGEIVTSQGFLVNEGDTVRYSGRRVEPAQRKIHIALNKPKRYLCSSSDPENRPLAISLVQPDFPERLFTVGRLDFLSSGLILVTNDGYFSKRVMHPSNRVEKEYVLEAKVPIPEELLQEYRRGIFVEGVRYLLKHYTYKNSRRVNLVLEEGKNREIRRVFETRKIGIKRLHRIRIGSVHLGPVPPGGYRFLTAEEVASLGGGR